MNNIMWNKSLALQTTTPPSSTKGHNNATLTHIPKAQASFASHLNKNNTHSSIKSDNYKANFLPLSNLSFGRSIKEHFSQGANVLNSKEGKVQFKIWAPNAKEITLQVISKESDKDNFKDFLSPLNNDKLTIFKDDKDRKLAKNQVKEIKMVKDKNNYFSVTAKNIMPGDLYRYRITDHHGKVKNLKDLTSRSQPYDSKGWSAVYDNNAYQWKDNKWMNGQDPRRIRYVESITKLNSISELEPPEDMIIDEVHVKAFTEQGNFEAAKEKIKKIAKDGIYNTIQLMPINEFPGDKSWGYNGVDMFSPESSYGGPEKLKELIDTAHKAGLNVVLDVVYNHWGTQDCVAHEYGPYFHPNKDTEWGKPFNFNHAGDDSAEIRKFAVDNALYWLKEFHVDGLRLDQTSKMFSHDTLKIMAKEIRHHIPGAVLIAEDKSCLRRLTLPLEDKDVNVKNEDQISEIGDHTLARMGFDAQWNMSLVHTLQELLISGYNAIDDLETEMTQGVKHYVDKLLETPKPYNVVNYFLSHDESGNYGGKRLIHKVLVNSVIRDSLRDEARDVVTKAATEVGVWLGDHYDAVVEDQIDKWIDQIDGDQVIFKLIDTYKTTKTETEWNKAVTAIAQEHDVKEITNISRKGFTAKLKDALAIHRLAIGILFITPGHKMLLMGDEEAELAPFQLDVDNSIIGKPKYQDSKAKKFTKEVAALWKKHPALKNGNAYNIRTYKKDGAIAVHRFDESKKDNIFAIINFTDKDKPDFSIPFPVGNWKQVINSNDKQFGGHYTENNNEHIIGKGLYNEDAHMGADLPKKSILIFEAV